MRVAIPRRPAPSAAAARLRPARRRLETVGLAGTLVCGAFALGGCSSLQHLVGGEKVDYRDAPQAASASLEVPPDLTQLARDSRFQQPGGTVSATTFQGGGVAALPGATAGASPVATPTSAVGDVAATSSDVRLERAGNERWVSTTQSPDAVWPQLQAFWRENGMTLRVDEAKAGVMETEWAENKANLPNDLIRNYVGRVFDPLYSTGERDKFRTRLERTAGGGSEIYISHRGLQEVYTTPDKAQTAWQPRPVDPELEAIMLQRLMVKLGANEQAAKTMVAATAQPGGTVGPARTTPARARILEGQPAATLQVDDGFDRAWRRVGLALDRGGFTVEDRDRSQGVYYVRYVDPKYAGREEPNFFERLFSFGRKGVGGPAKYRVAVKAEPVDAGKTVADHSTVTVLDTNGNPENGDPGKRIVALMLDELK